MTDKSAHTRRGFLTLLAAGPLLGLPGRTRATETADTVPAAAVDGPGRVSSRRTARLFGTYNGNTTVRFLYEGERRRTQSGALVLIDEPIEDDGLVEDNPFNLHISSKPSIADAGGAYEGMYNVNSAATYFRGASAPGIDYRPRDTWLEQHWDLTLDNRRLGGSLTATNNNTPNAMWYEQPGSSVDIGYGPPVVFDAAIAPAGFRIGTTIDGAVTRRQFSATITGSSAAIDAFEITVTATRPRI